MACDIWGSRVEDKPNWEELQRSLLKEQIKMLGLKEGEEMTRDLNSYQAEDTPEWKEIVARIKECLHVEAQLLNELHEANNVLIKREEAGRND